MSIGRLAALLLGLVLIVAGCSGQDGRRHPDLAVGSALDGDSKLLAALYVSALRSYGFPSHAEAAADPMAKLDSGAFTVVPGYTGRVLRQLQPGASELADKQVYQAMNAALPEGVAAGDYATAAEDKPTLIVTPATSAAWGGSDLTLLLTHCDGLAVGAVTGRPAPSPVGSCKLPAPREFPDGTTMFAALRAGELTVAWATSADPGIPPDLIALADSSKDSLVQAENVVPLYRRNALSTRQLLAVNEIAGVLDTAALADLRRKVAAGADPQVVADGWLGEHPLGR
ncbi:MULTISPECIES: glycine betaine ABC transporter substrate-binding protein [unclassified Mycobacterium]|uniref:glycine betaine ABC transporter substrate-binding protein n=1 Tax=unclassified Mycobacterium TaxID=2642494 RepID=UPI002740661D|nr:MULTISPECIES: glycine betaine ABC transporter substrate-binding protein [unclassified Mycobacterium]MDP7705467.1 glycine betaine ABC transporter substrate-binding protein [Mycobacterium sp. TY815]MDP7724913.1 glycine betaine ABC transporter substrate-binding protein [Mycobacterium sp. TY814]